MPENDFKWKDDKESVMLLKQKICRTHDLILQYSSKVKENSHIKSDLTFAKKEAKRMIYKYKSAMDKIKELELKVTQVKQINEKLTNQMNEHNADTTADKQTIQQFICKMKELEEKHSVKIMEYDLQKFSFEEKIKILEQELKKSEQKLKKMKKKAIDSNINISKQDIETKSTADISDKKNVFNTSLYDVLNFRPIVETQDKSIMTDDSTPVDVKLASNINTNWVKSTSDIGINTILCEANFQSKFEMQDKNIMTDEFYNTANNPLPLFCAKCEAHLPLDLLPEQIYKTMCIYPKLIKEDQGTIPKKNSSSSCSLLDTYPDFINKEIISSNELCVSHLNSNNHNNSITINETTPSMIQNSKNVESSTTVSQTNIMTHVPVTTNLSNDLNFISAINLPESENANCTKKSLCTNDLIKQSSFIKEIEKKLELLESKIKKFPKLKKKQNIYSCHYCKDKDISLNSDLLTALFKSVVQYYNDKREKNASFRDEQNKLRRNKHEPRMKKKLKKRKRLKKYNKYKNSFLWKTEHLDENFSRNIFYKLEDAKATNVSQFDCNTSCTTTHNTNTNMNNLLLDINTVNRPLDNKFDKESILFIRDSQMVTDTMPVLSNSQNSINHINNKVITKNEMKKENFKKDNHLLKNIKNLKRLMQTNSQMNKQENSILCSDHNVEHDELIKSRIERERSNYSLKNISNLKRKLEDPANSSINIQKNVELYSNSHESMKKLRIAHVPKSSVLQSSIIQKDFIHHTLKNVAVTETFQQKHDEKQRLDAPIQENDLSIENEKSHMMKKRNKKNIVEYVKKCNEMHDIDNGFEENSINNGDYLNNDNSFPLKMNVAQASVSLGLDKCDNDKVPIDTIDTNADAVAGKIIAKKLNNCVAIDVSCNDISYNIMTNLEFESSDSSNFPCKTFKHNEYNEDVEKDMQTKKIGITEKVTSIDELKYTSDTNAEKNCDDYAISRNTILNDDRLSLLNRSNVLDMSGYENYDIFITTSKCQHLPIVKNNEDIENSIVQIPRKKINTNKQQEIIKCINVSHDNEELRTPICWLIKYVNKKSITCQVSHKMIYISTMTDKFIRKQLQRFADNVWEDTIYHEVIQNLTNTCGSRIIAKCIIEFLSENANNNNILDKSFTPPAPLMTTFEQNLIALLTDLEILKPGIIHFIQIGIQYKLFKLNNDIKNLNEVDTLTRIYVVLSRIQKDREKIRIMCCDALYCMGLKSISLLYIILTCWPEVLPNAEINIGILPKCIAFLIGWQQINSKRKTSLSRLRALKSLIMSFYKYSYSQETINDLVKEFIANLKVKQTDGLHTAIILIAKKEGPSWTYKNIINSTLLPMIINHEYPCIYNGFSLLGRLLRAFPLKSKIVQDITEQLHDLIKSGQGSHDQQEGIISALLSLSRHNFDIVALSVLRWMPNTSLKSTTIMQLEAFIKMYKTKLWELFKTNCIKP